MSYEISQNGNVIFRGWEDPAVIQERLKRADELSVELERVKAEHEWMKECLVEAGIIAEFAGKLATKTEFQELNGTPIKTEFKPISKQQPDFYGKLFGTIIGFRYKEFLPIQSELKRVKAERDALKASLNEIRNDLERIVCTEGEDAGVFFLSPESPSNYDPELNCHVYVHEHFSELGGALVNLYKTVVSEGGVG